MAGIGSSPSSALIVVDNDSVMTSNLSRQMCFTAADTNKPKATTLANRAKNLFNTNTNIIPVVLKLDHTTESVLNSYWDMSLIDCYVTALDNISARNTVERISQMWDKLMINGATEGFEGQQNNFVPGITDEYYDPTAEFMANPVSCTPKVILHSKDDVIHNAKIHYENMVKKIHEEDIPAEEHLRFFLHDITSTLENKSPKHEFKVVTSPEQHTRFLASTNSLLVMKQNGALEMFFDKDEVCHVKHLQAMCEIVASIHKIPAPDCMEIRKKAGSIIPSIISTTAVIAGFMLLNALQIASSSPRFFNIMYDQAELMRTIPAARNPTRQSIFLHKKLDITTKFREIFQQVSSRVPNIHKITIYGDAKVETQDIEATINERVLDFVSKHVSLNARRHFVIEVLYMAAVQDGSVRKLVKDTKFVIVFMPDHDTLAYVADRIKCEKQLENARETNKDLVTKLTQSETTIKQVEHAAQQLRNELTQAQTRAAKLELELSSHQAAGIQLRKVNKYLEGEVQELKPYRSFLSAVFGQLQSIVQQISNTMSKSGIIEPLCLPNHGNTCFLASMTQVLYAAHVHSRGALFGDCISPIGKCFERLFKLRGREQWSAVVQEFFRIGAGIGFRLGKQDDSSKAFKLVMEHEWPNPATVPDVHVLLSEISSKCTSCDKPRVASRTAKTYIQYAGNDQPDADIGEEYYLQESFDHPCSCKGELQERCEYYRWPPVLFMATTSSKDFLRAAVHGAKFRQANGQFMQYSLIAASIHSGGTTAGGHYTAISNLDGKWYASSDAHSNQVDIAAFNSRGSQYEDIQLLAFAHDKFAL